MNKLSQLLNKTYGELIFGLLCGVSYYIISLKFIFLYTYHAASLLALYIAPVIICGIALVFIKTIRSWRLNEQYKKIDFFVFAHVIVFIASIAFLIDYILFGV